MILHKIHKKSYGIDRVILSLEILKLEFMGLNNLLNVTLLLNNGKMESVSVSYQFLKTSDMKEKLLFVVF